jgi:hypothetical protein
VLLTTHTLISSYTHNGDDTLQSYQTRTRLLPSRILLIYKNVTSDDHVITFASDKPFVLVDTEQKGLEENTKLAEKRVFKNKWKQ